MSPFVPVGDAARWRFIYDELTKLNVDDVLTYEALADTLDLDAKGDRHKIQMAVRRAAKEYLEVDKRALDAVPNVGYRVVEASEHLMLAQRFQRKSNRALVAGRSRVVNVDMNALEPEARKAFEVVAIAFSQMLDFQRRMDVRQKRLEQAVDTIANQHERSQAEIDQLKERLAKLEQQ
jgi:hypothetical protein